MKLLQILLICASVALFFACADTVDSGDNNGNGNDNGDDNGPQGTVELVYFWFLDNDLPNDTELEIVDATYPSGNSAFIEYFSSLEGYPNTGRDGSLERRNRPTDINYRDEGNGNIDFENAEGSMRALQVRDPFVGSNGENYMVFHLPTDGFSDIAFSFASKDEGAAEGLIFDYSVSSGNPNWTTEGMVTSEINQDLMTDEYQFYELDFTDIEGANDNDNFKVRIRFDTTDGQANDGNRVTFNNFALDGIAL